MLNDSIINFYLLYVLTDYIDSCLDVAGIDKKKVQELAHDPVKMSPAYVSMDFEEASLLTLVKPLLNRFAIATSFMYPQLRRLVSVIESIYPNK